MFAHAQKMASFLRIDALGEYENYTKTSKFYDTGEILLDHSGIIIFDMTVIGRQPIGLDVFLGSIAQLTNGDMKKASLVDIGEQANPLLESSVQLQVTIIKNPTTV